METLQIRTATKADLAAIQRLFHQGDSYHAGLLPDVFNVVERARPDDRIEAPITGSDSVVFLAVSENQVVGFLVLKEGGRPDYRMLRPKRLGIVEDIVVDETERGKGIGTKLLKEACSWSEARGLQGMQLHVWTANRGAVRLYEREGFRRVVDRMEMELGEADSP